MWLGNIADGIYRVLTPFSRILVTIGSICLAGMMFLTAVDVAGRYFFSRPVKGAFDLTEYLMVVVFAFALPYCTLKKGHVSVDVLVSRFSSRARMIINAATAPIILALFSLFVWQIFAAIWIQYDSGIVSSVLRISRYPFFILLFLGYVCFVIVLLGDMFKNIAEAVKK